MTAVGFVALTVGTAAVGEDFARRRISNWTSGAALLSGFAVHGVQQGWHGAVSAAAGAAVGFAVFAVFYLLNGMGGGDVKLMAGFGSLLGPATILCAAWIAAVAGGLMAVASAADSGGAPEVIRWANDGGCRRHTLRAGHCCGCVAGRDCPGIEIENNE